MTQGEFIRSFIRLHGVYEGAMVELETIPLQDVPASGVYIYKVNGAWHVYKKTNMIAVNKYIVSELIYSTRTGEKNKGTWNFSDYDKQVVYTGIILRGR